MDVSEKIYVAGHQGLVGSALLRRLRASGYVNTIVRQSQELDLISQRAVTEFFAAECPKYVFLAAARVGGIAANSKYPAEFIYQNLAIQGNVMDAAYRSRVSRLLFLGSSCIYPKHAAQPIKEEYLLTGPLEPTNRSYAVAKISGVEMCWAYNRQYGTKFMAAMPTNLYGPRDRYDLETSHVLPALLRKMHEAKVSGANHVVVWGTGSPRREFLHSDDAADACVFLMNLPDEALTPIVSNQDLAPIVNVGSGEDLSIRELAEVIASVTGFEGELVFDRSRPDGTPRKLLDVGKLTKLGWKFRVGLREGISRTYQELLKEKYVLSSSIPVNAY
ncbi:MAG: GDP-L-fucose synthase [Acidobacteria bacterium]|nr:GDP-L-fucose synthase [Acidobacteriota bacterium]